jgi:lysophospholipase L1-like esterase
MSPDEYDGSDSGQPAKTREHGRNRRRKTVRAISILIYPFYLIGLLLLCEKLFWMFAYNVPLSRAATKESTERLIWNMYYPELDRMVVEHNRHRAEPDRFEVILLGGSVLAQAAPSLQSALIARLGDGVKVHSLARSAHTSRDSYLKYRKIADRDIDMIIIYDCINDVRMNCVERSKFRDDYSHCAWYQSFYDRLAKGTPTLLEYVGERTIHNISLGPPDEKTIAFGGDVKTEAAFRQNIEYIVADANSRGIPVVIMSFAYHLPANYSRELLKQGALDYSGDCKFPAEIWGLPANVAKTIDRHNAIIRDLKNKYNSIIFVDQRSLLPRNGQIFSDPCHFTDLGCKEFARNVADRLPATLALGASDREDESR